MLKNLEKNLDVWSLIHGKGRIKEIGETSLVCAFNNGMQDVFNKEGKLYNFPEGNRVIFFSEPQIQALNEPKEKAKGKLETKPFNPSEALKMKELVSKPINLYAHIVNEIYSFFKNNPEILHIGIIKNNFIPLSSKFEISLRDKKEKKEYGYFSNNQTEDENLDKIVTLVSYFNFVYDKWINDGNTPFAAYLLISREEYPNLSCEFKKLSKEVISKLNKDTLDYFEGKHL